MGFVIPLVENLRLESLLRIQFRSLKNVHRPHMFFFNLRSMTLEMCISNLKMIWLLFMVKHTTQYPSMGLQMRMKGGSPFGVSKI
jgi:hypothetical protein